MEHLKLKNTYHKCCADNAHHSGYGRQAGIEKHVDHAAHTFKVIA